LHENAQMKREKGGRREEGKGKETKEGARGSEGVRQWIRPSPPLPFAHPPL